jgi:hypothetical protein
MKPCPLCNKRYQLDKNYNYPVCSDCKESLTDTYEFEGIDFKFYWNLHTMVNSAIEIIKKLQKEPDLEQFNQFTSTLKHIIDKAR